MKNLRQYIRKLIKESIEEGPSKSEVRISYMKHAEDYIWNAFGEGVLYIQKDSAAKVAEERWKKRTKGDWERNALDRWENTIRGGRDHNFFGWSDWDDLKNSKEFADLQYLIDDLLEFLVWLKHGDHSEPEAIKIRDLVFSDVDRSPTVNKAGYKYRCAAGFCRQAHALWQSLYG